MSRSPVIVVLLAGIGAPAIAAEDPAKAEVKETLILAHYMPWFVAKPASPVWGWHWTMNAFDPERVDPATGRRQIASHFHPLIGPYDSGDPAVIEYHLLLMKLAGIDGIVVDWYGLSDLNDYSIIHRNTAAILAAAERIGLKLAICYEDQTIPRLVEAGRLAQGDRVKHAREMLAWLGEHWFRSPEYLRWNGRPVLLSFGRDGLSDREWQEVLPEVGAPVYLSEHRRRPRAEGGFDWPVPKEGIAAFDRFREESAAWPVRMPAAFVRFKDIYAEAKVHASYGELPDRGGSMLASTLGEALAGRPPFVQVATWNDWGEGTQVEPSAEVGFRDLETIQRLRRERIDRAFAPRGEDLRLALRLYHLRGIQAARPELRAKLDEAAVDLANGRIATSREILGRLESAALSPPEEDGPFLRPASGIAAEPTWGIKGGIAVGLWPNRGPRGLIRIYTPYLGQPRLTPMNFVAIEPIVGAARGLSELEPSRLDPGMPGKAMWSADRLQDATSPHDPSRPARGVVGEEDGHRSLRVFFGVEPFNHGARPIVEVAFREDRPHEVAFRVFAAEGSATMRSCILTATMGNYARLRVLSLKDRLVTAASIYHPFRPIVAGFAAHREWTLDELSLRDGRAIVAAAPDEADPTHATYDRDVHRGWHYRGDVATQYWSAPARAALVARVNARETYWASTAKIPGGVAFENLELEAPFESGQEFRFGIVRGSLRESGLLDVKPSR
ncbi:glycoside hydrolase family 71/99-like protein [Aquisphaera insulae]|uniref:glycoside hydrolase family 71/99-like protein n=1 Tax=Aquisphaera insulae TaxID=2712864 RepID=UPI00196AA883|nr:glycoside hydrolase family 71/99-like protein [Aquisphaera insulae]